MQELINDIKELQDKLIRVVGLLDIEAKQTKIKVLEEEVNSPGFWDDQEKATMVSKQLADLQEEVGLWEDLGKEIGDVLAIAREADKEGDNSLKQDLVDKYKEFKSRFENLEFAVLLSDEHDRSDCVLAIHAGTGGVDAMDWAQSLERMILRYAEKKGYQVDMLDRSLGGEAGIKSVVMEIKGRFAYGYLKSEAGVHRLVRISPFDAEKMRHTSFALIEVLPVLRETKEAEVKDEDVEIDTFRSSGHGGQSVNTTDSAVRARHKPTGITVVCQNERSQLQNKQTALRILRSKLHQYYKLEKEEEKQRLRGEYSEAVWGNQIRSYVLHPYKMVKDHRTDYETQDVEGVLDGELDELVKSYLEAQCGSADLSSKKDKNIKIK